MVFVHASLRRYQNNDYMKNRLIVLLSLVIFGGNLVAQQLIVFNVAMQPGAKSYLGIAHKKSYTEHEAAEAKSTLDLSLVFTKDDLSPKLEWYNLSGKDGKVPERLTGTAAKINAISFDRQQFDKCKTAEDLQRMTTHITPNSFSHFAVISHTKGVINQHCFIVETIGGKRALLWIDKGANDDYKISVKQQP